MQIPKRLTEQQRKAQLAFAKLLQNPTEADQIYNDELLDSIGGRIVSTDISRFLDKRYRNNYSSERRICLTDGTSVTQFCRYPAHMGRRREEQHAREG